MSNDNDDIFNDFYTKATNYYIINSTLSKCGIETEIQYLFNDYIDQNKISIEETIGSYKLCTHHSNGLYTFVTNSVVKDIVMHNYYDYNFDSVIFYYSIPILFPKNHLIELIHYTSV